MITIKCIITRTLYDMPGTVPITFYVSTLLLCTTTPHVGCHPHYAHSADEDIKVQQW